MKLSQLLASIQPVRIGQAGVPAAGTSVPDNCPHASSVQSSTSAPDLDIASIHYRAQEVAPGGIFVAIRGHNADGHDFIEVALKQGAAVLVVHQDADLLSQPCETHTKGQKKRDVVVIYVDNTRQALANMAATFYGHPSEHQVVIGITGTNGKTTTAYLVEGILQQAGYKTGLIGTINYHYAGKTYPNPNTTPESLDLQRILASMRNAGVTHVVMEASSHAISLYRIQSCWFDIGVFTNLSQDHLDFHGSMQSYWHSKKLFFTDYLSAGPKKARAHAVINCDTSYGQELAKLLTIPVIHTGKAQACTIRADAVTCKLGGTTGTISTPDGSFTFTSALVGTYNVENILCATGAATALGLSLHTIKCGVESVTHIAGRLEPIANNAGRHVYVDYAHTPDALENAIRALRAVTSHRVICVFGCGGDRDRAKRPMMGEIAAKHCDLTIITSDNPRTEHPHSIIEQILQGATRGGGIAYSRSELNAGFTRNGYVTEPDRRSAIELGIRLSQPGDTVLIAGKGHETYQILDKTTVTFDDREEARNALARLGA